MSTYLYFRTILTNYKIINNNFSIFFDQYTYKISIRKCKEEINHKDEQAHSFRAACLLGCESILPESIRWLISILFLFVLGLS